MIDTTNTPKFTIEMFSRRNLLGAKRHYFRIVASNGEIVAASEAYTARSKAIHTVDRLRTHLGNARVVVVS